MQFKAKQPPEVGDKRITKRFLILPREINGIIKWLEVASWEQEYKTVYHFEDSVLGIVEVPSNIWIDIRWVDKNTV